MSSWGLVWSRDVATTVALGRACRVFPRPLPRKQVSAMAWGPKIHPAQPPSLLHIHWWDSTACPVPTSLGGGGCKEGAAQTTFVPPNHLGS